MRAIDLIVVHCSATPAGRDVSAADIDGWHKARGWRCIGYHHVIRMDGTVEPGRPEREMGAHASGFNRNSIGLCMIGGLDAEGFEAKPEYTPAQWEALGRLLAELKGRYPAARIVGHRDLPGVRKACPSFEVGAWLADGRVKP